MIEEMIVDADLCIKLGCSNKYRYLYNVLPQISKNICMHTHVYGEVMVPTSALNQLDDLISEGKVVLVNEKDLNSKDRSIYDATFKNLEKVMIDPRKPNKNKGEICSLAYAKAVGIPVFATDEKNLQRIIDTQLNTGINDIICIRIIDIVQKARNGEIEIPRKVAKAMWVISGKDKFLFDTEIWPVQNKG